MQDDKVRDRAADEAPRDAGTVPVASKKRKYRRWALIVLGVVVVVPSLLMAAWIAIALHWSYSEGNRAGYIQKFSHKGWVCKTWEGELAMVNMPGASQDRFAFTVRDDSVAKQITRLMGSRVSVTYQEHRGVPGTCFRRDGVLRHGRERSFPVIWSAVWRTKPRVLRRRRKGTEGYPGDEPNY